MLDSSEGNEVVFSTNSSDLRAFTLLAVGGCVKKTKSYALRRELLNP
jgi:hypothetical protein